jgi:putative DNA primase/helicase
MTRQEAIAAILRIVDDAAAPLRPAITDSSPLQKNGAPAKPRGRSFPASPTDAVATAAAAASRSSDPPNSSAFSHADPLAAGKQPASSQTGGSGGQRGWGERGGRATNESTDALNRRLGFFPLTDLGNADRFVERQRGKLMWCQAIGWLWWDGQRWSRDGADQVVRRAEHETVRAIQLEAKALAAEMQGLGARGKQKPKHAAAKEAAGAQNKKAEKESAAKAKARIKLLDGLSVRLAAWGRKSEANSKIVSIEKNAGAYLTVNTAELDADPMMINVANGTLVCRRDWSEEQGDWQSWLAYGDYIRLKPHDPADLITKLAPVAFKPDAERPQFDAFLKRVQPPEKMRRFLQQWRGYSMTGDASEHCIALFIGGGRNGKSVFEDSTSHVGGDYAETVPIETFLASGREANANAPTPARALLYNARMVRTSEPNKGVSFDEGFIKLVTGGEPIQARNLNLPMFRFVPIMKLTVSGNHRPKIGGADEGIWSRIKLVPWLVMIPKEERDRMLTKKLRGEASGILNWMLDGLSDWMEHGLVFPDEVEQATAEYRRDSDQLGRFLEACVVAAVGEKVQSSKLLAVFNAHAQANGGTEWKHRGLANAMTERGYKKDKSSVMFWLDIKLIRAESDFIDLSGRPRSAADASAGERDGSDEFIG